MSSSSAPAISLEEVVVLSKVIDKGFRNGLFAAEEAVVVAPLYQKLTKILRDQGALPQPPSEKSETS